MKQSLTYFMKLKSLLPSNVRQIQINLPNKIFALKITQSSIHLIVLAFGAINLHWYTCFIVIYRIYYPLFLSQKLPKLFSIVEQNCHHQHKVLKFGDMATNLAHKTEFSSKTSNEWLGWPHLSPVLKYIVRCCRFLIINKMTSLKIGNKLKGEEGTKIQANLYFIT